MKNQLSLFNKVFYEYFFLIRPDYELSQKIKFFKRKVKSLIPLSEENLRSAPHLSLLKFAVGRNIDDSIVLKTVNALQGIKSFKIKVDGPGIYFHGNTKRSLVLKIEDPGAIISLDEKLLREFNFHQRAIRPHITIARSVPLNDFNKLVCSLNEFDCNDEFVCTKVTILKKEVEEKSHNYKILREVNLN